MRYLTEGFKPESDAKDRRILYEVTGLSLKRDEFIEDESSDSCEDCHPDDDDDDTMMIEHAFRYNQVAAGHPERLNPMSINT